MIWPTIDKDKIILRITDPEGVVCTQEEMDLEDCLGLIDSLENCIEEIDKMAIYQDAPEFTAHSIVTQPVFTCPRCGSDECESFTDNYGVAAWKCQSCLAQGSRAVAPIHDR